MRFASLVFAIASLAAPSLGFPCGSLVSKLSKKISWYAGLSEAALHQNEAPEVHHETIYNVLKGRKEYVSGSSSPNILFLTLAAIALSQVQYSCEAH